MPVILEKTIIVGPPNSGKSTYIRGLNSNILFWKDYRMNALKDTNKRIEEEIEKRLFRHNPFYADEPFFLIPPLLCPNLFGQFKNHSFFVSTHRISYFSLICPSKIILADNFSYTSITPERLVGLVEKPSEDVYYRDCRHFVDFLNTFSDVDISPETFEEIVKNPLLNAIRTTPFVRDAIIMGVYGVSIKEYLKRIIEYFNKNSKDIPITHRTIINKQLSPLEII